MTVVPYSFDRIKTTKLPAVEGWVYVTPIKGGDAFRVTGSGQRAEYTDHRDVRATAIAMLNRLGGPVLYQRGPTPSEIADSLIESDEDIESDLQRLLTGFKPEALKRRESSYADGYLKFNGKLGYGNGITPSVYIYRIVRPGSRGHGVTKWAEALVRTCERWAAHGMARKGPAKGGARGPKSTIYTVGYYPP